MHFEVAPGPNQLTNYNSKLWTQRK